MNQKPPTILIVEDDKSIRTLVSIILKHAGYRVLEASGPKEAATIWNAQSTAIDLFFSDILMPGQSGPELAEELLAKQPTLKVLFTSGNSMSMDADITRLGTKSRILQKPYALPQLLEAVEAALRDFPRSVEKQNSYQ